MGIHGLTLDEVGRQVEYHLVAVLHTVNDLDRRAARRAYPTFLLAVHVYVWLRVTAYCLKADGAGRSCFGQYAVERRNNLRSFPNRGGDTLD